MQDIWLKKVALLLIKPLRHVPILNVRVKGYNWYVRLSRSLYNYTELSADVKDTKQLNRIIWKEGLKWRLKDGEQWTLKSFYPLYFEDQKTGDEGGGMEEDRKQRLSFTRCSLRSRDDSRGE